MDEQPVQITRRASSVKPDANGHLLPNGFNLAALLEEELHEDDTVLAVTCRVCQNEIILADEEGFVVKCPKCNEATVSLLVLIGSTSGRELNRDLIFPHPPTKIRSLLIRLLRGRLSPSAHYLLTSAC